MQLQRLRNWRWTGTWGTGNNNRACLQTDGNFVVYNTSGPVWNSSTSGFAIGSLYIAGQNSQSFQLIVANTGTSSMGDHTSVWSSATRSALGVQDLLTNNQSLRSANGNYTLTTQTDGNVVLAKTNGQILWHANSYGKGGRTFGLNDVTGQAEIYGTNGQVVWQSPTTYVKNSSSVYPGILVLQDDGNLVLYTNAGQAVWNTGTANK